MPHLKSPPLPENLCPPQIYIDTLTNSEYFSDAKKIEVVEWKDPETGEPVDTGLVRVQAVKQTQGGIKLAGVGGSGAAGFEGGEKEAGDDEEGGEEAEETKLDQFWTFPDIENEHTFASFGEFKKNYFMPYLVAWQKLSVDKGLAKDAAEMKAKGKKMADGLGALGRAEPGGGGRFCCCP